MGINYPYVLAIKRFQKFFNELVTAKKVNKIDNDYLNRLSYGNSAAKFINVLKFIGFIDNKNQTTDKYEKYFNSTERAVVMKEILQSSYSEIFSQFPNACDIDNSTILQFIKPDLPNLNDETRMQVVKTFKVLCKFADFKDIDNDNIKNVQNENIKDVQNENNNNIKKDANIKSYDIPITLNVNIQITLPETSNYEIYDNIFKSLKKNLMESKN